METLEELQPDSHRIVELGDSRHQGFIVIDRYLNGGGTGGIRMTADLTVHEVARLAHEMTLKFATLNIPRGGAKAGLVIPDNATAEERAELCRHFGKGISDLLQKNEYVAGLDLGTRKEDLTEILASAGMPQKNSEIASSVDSNFYTALTVSVAAQSLLHVRNVDIAETSVSVEGFGNVGTHLCKLLSDAGAQIVGVSTSFGSVHNPNGFDIDALIAAKQREGDEFVQNLPGIPCMPREALFSLACDLLIPGARPDSINAENIDTLNARYIVPIANICATEAIESELHKRGIDFIPGFVTNCGGIFCWYVASLSDNVRRQFFAVDFSDKVRRLICEADRKQCGIAQIARDHARDNFRRMKAEETGNKRSRLTALMRKLSWRRLGYVMGRKAFGQHWAGNTGKLGRLFFDSRYLR